LHTLLHKADIADPYVMAGHSMGGLPALMFAHDYPTEVAGLVLIESMSPPQFSHSTTDAATLPTAASPAFTPLPILGRLGIVRLLARPFGLIPALPKDVQPAYLARLVRPSNLQAVTDEMQGMPASATQVEAVKTIGNMPLIVLTSRSNHNPSGWQAWQAELPKLSSNSQQLFAEKGGHNIEIDEPEAAVAAIAKMVEMLRQP
jgi:pimeloyl-ACP methyl ester carboxylesterase